MLKELLNKIKLKNHRFILLALAVIILGLFLLFNISDNNFLTGAEVFSIDDGLQIQPAAPAEENVSLERNNTFNETPVIEPVPEINNLTQPEPSPPEVTAPPQLPTENETIPLPIEDLAPENISNNAPEELSQLNNLSESSVSGALVVESAPLQTEGMFQI